MSYTDMRDFTAEFTTKITEGGDTFTVEIEKAGGGTVGRKYDGTWWYRVLDSDGTVVTSGMDLETRTAVTHGGAAKILWGFLSEEL